MLCGLVLRGVVSAVQESSARAGVDFRLVTVSFDPRDVPANAARKQQSVFGALGDTLPASAWPFLSGDANTIDRLTAALGYRVAFEPSSKQYVHPAAIVVLNPDGRISRYLYGVEFPSRDFRLAIAEAREGRGGPAFDRVLLTCFRFDPATRRYGFAIKAFLRTGAALVAVALVVGLVRLRRREGRETAP
jgi:protein SCO1/2